MNKKAKKKNHLKGQEPEEDGRIGSDFDDFLEEEGIKNEVELLAKKKILVLDKQNELKNKQKGK